MCKSLLEHARDGRRHQRQEPEQGDSVFAGRQGEEAGCAVSPLQRRSRYTFVASFTINPLIIIILNNIIAMVCLKLYCFDVVFFDDGFF
jgi:hypothetical protein